MSTVLCNICMEKVRFLSPDMDVRLYFRRQNFTINMKVQNINWHMQNMKSANLSHSLVDIIELGCTCIYHRHLVKQSWSAVVHRDTSQNLLL